MGLTGLIDSLLNWIDAISSGRTQAAIIAVEAVASILGAIALIVVIAVIGLAFGAGYLIGKILL